MPRSSNIVKVSAVGIAVNIVLVIFKAAVGFVTGSIAISMDAVNNLSDALSSIITIVGTKLATREPDKKHPYGHGQIEYITSVTVSVIVLLAGITAFEESLKKILHPERAVYTVPALIIIAVAVAVKYVLGRYVRSRGRALNSDALVASGTDAMFDALISLGTLIAALVSVGFHINIEGWVGAAISIVMLKTGTQLMLASLGDIIGSRVDSELSLRLKAFICQSPEVLGAYDLSLHRYGPERIIGSVHVELPDQMTARQIHSLTRKLAEDVYESFGILLTVGIYASNTADGIFARMKEDLNAVIRAYPDVLQMHGFYVDTEKNNVSFDLIIDFKCPDRLGVRDEIVRKISEKYPDYTFSVVLDNDISD